MQIKLSKYITRLDSKFEAVRREYEKIQDSLSESTTYHKAKMRLLNPLGRNKELVRYQDEQIRLKNSLAQLHKDFDADYAVIREEARKTFRELYVLDGSAVDPGMVTVFESGVLSDTELVEYGKHYIETNNFTMLRLLGKYAGERAQSLPEHTQLKADMTYLENAGRDAGRRSDLELLDGMKQICDMSIRDDRLLADGTYNRVYNVDTYLSVGEKISVDVESPFES